MRAKSIAPSQTIHMGRSIPVTNPCYWKEDDIITFPNAAMALLCRQYAQRYVQVVSHHRFLESRGRPPRVPNLGEVSRL